MAFGSLEAADDNEPLAQINMVPLIDVMLVLLVIFIVTAPLLTHAVKVDLPRASSTPSQTHADSIQLAIDGDSQVFWNGERLAPEELGVRLESAGRLQPAPELHIRAERSTPYERIAQVMSDAARNGLVRIGFVTDPRR